MQLVNMASTQRARNDAEPSAVAKVLRAELANGIDPTQFMMTNLEKVIELNCQILVGLLSVSSRPIASVIEEAAGLAFPRTPKDDKVAFAQRMCACLSLCRRKLKNSRTGTRLTKPMAAVVRSLQQQRMPPKPSQPPSLGKQLRQRFLKRIHSGGSDSVQLLPAKRKASGSSGDAYEKVMEPCGPSASEVAALFGHSQTPPPLPIMEEIMSSQEAPVRMQYMDYRTGTLMRSLEDGSTVAAHMTPGPDGFMVAEFGSERIQTEVPVLAVVAKKPSKKPAAAPSIQMEVPAEQGLATSDDEVASDAEAPAAEVCAAAKGKAKAKAKAKAAAKAAAKAKSMYNTMRYPSGAHAIRQTFGLQKQVFQIKRDDEATAKAIIQSALERLASGEAEDSVKQWAKAQ